MRKYEVAKSTIKTVYEQVRSSLINYKNCEQVWSSVLLEYNLGQGEGTDEYG